jgi:predicted O-methyltransferase YrrM
LTVIDPFLDRFYPNLKASESESKVRIIQGFSQIELRKLPLESFDIIYIDGSHDAADVLEDAILSWRLLKDGGVLIFDDYLLSAGMERSIDTFFSFFSGHFEPVHVGWQVLMKKRVTSD